MKNISLICKNLLFVLCAFSISLSVKSQENLKAKLNIDFSAEAIAYDRMIFGQFIEHFHRQIYGGIFEPGSKLSDEQGFRKDVIEALRELKVPVVRWPGGCFVSAYHWMEGIGPIRTPSWDKAWHVEDPNTFGTDEFIAWCRKIGAEPYICTNAGTGTPEEMSNWVEYCNLKNMGRYARLRIANGNPEPFNVKYWSIGNENYTGGEMGAKTVDEWGYFVRESSKLMVNVDPKIKLAAAALPDSGWTIPLLQRAGQYLSMVSIHGYWDPLWRQNNPSDYLTCMLYTTEPEIRIKNTIRILEMTGYDKNIKIAFDEWNLRGWHHPWMSNRSDGRDNKAMDKNDINSTYTMADAVFSACFLNSCLRNADYVTMACMAPVVNARGPLYVYPGGMVKRTTYHVLNMYANMLQPFILKSSLVSDSLKHKNSSVPVTDAVVTSDKEMKLLSIILVNKHPEKAADIDLGIGNINKMADVNILSGDSKDAYNDIDNPFRVVPVSIKTNIKNGIISVPPHSVIILEITSDRLKLR